MKKLLVYSAILLISSCAQWKVSELQKNVLFEIESGTVPGKLDFSPNENGNIEMTFDVRISHNQVLCSDNRQHRFQIFNLDGEPELSIGPLMKNSASNEQGTDQEAEAEGDQGETDSPIKSVLEKVDPSIQIVDFSFGMIGKFVSDAEGRIFIENSILPVDNDNRNKRTEGVDLSPSFIMVFNKEGKILYNLGRNGSSEVPFHSIYEMYTDNKGRLFVVSKSSENWSVFRYDGKRRDFDAHFNKETFQDDSSGESYEGLVENIIIFNSGNKLLISVAYYDSIRFKYRKIYEYDVEQKRLGKAILELPDPKNELFSILEDQYIILWDAEQRDLRFSIWNLQENIINNLKITLNGVRPYYEKVLVDEGGSLYTMIVNEDRIEIKEWK